MLIFIIIKIDIKKCSTKNRYFQYRNIHFFKNNFRTRAVFKNSFKYFISHESYQQKLF